MVPQIPRNLEEVNIENEWAETWSATLFLSTLDNNWGFAIFATSENYKVLQRCSEIYIDGTFKTCPSPYSQFLTIHGRYLGMVLPLVMCLLAGKQVGLYRQVLQHVRQQVRARTGHRLQPRTIICDFEYSLILAVQTELPRSPISGCYFHLCQSFWRKITKLGLSGAFRRHERLKKFLRKIMVIGYLPLAIVRANFRLLVATANTRRLIRRYPQLTNFVNYVERNYINANGQFPAYLWNVFHRNMDTRTNNSMESKSPTDQLTIH
jgi:hypothetical protein